VLAGACGPLPAPANTELEAIDARKLPDLLQMPAGVVANGMTASMAGAGSGAGAANPSASGTGMNGMAAAGAAGSAAIGGGAPAAGAAGLASTPDDSTGVRPLGAACTAALEKACVAHDSAEKLVCNQGVWASNGSCESGTRCDTQLGPTRGTCQPIPAGCLDKMPGVPACDGKARALCDADRLHYAVSPCPNNMHCEATGGCACDAGFRANGADSCMEIDECAANPCDAPGICKDGVNSYTCMCPDGYDAAGGKACKDLDECQGKNVCGEDTPCRNATPFYDCRGQFPDWSPAYTRSAFTISNGTVKDSRSGLVWQQMMDPGELNLTSAKAYCASLTLAGAKWRVPSIAEIESIVDDTQSTIAIDMSVFPNTPGKYFWSTTKYLGDSDTYWSIFGPDGNTSTALRATSMGTVRCVQESNP
jgi:hypothetical protein